MDAGVVVAGRFELERIAGAGGMGTVWRARDRVTGRAVAVKLAPASSRDLAERFEREAEVLCQLDHPALVGYVAHGTLGAELFLAMEWLEGEDLSQRLERQPLTAAESLALALRLADALGHAHGRGVVHRDVKPSNVLLVGGAVGAATLLDFGIARGSGLGRRVVTRAGCLVGTPGYMAPEQARGDWRSTPAADVLVPRRPAAVCRRAPGRSPGARAVRAASAVEGAAGRP
ncbi:MAG: serine/threonine protein kinase [Deltaproteobacteria bacterium]|nr:serine/threonine protein kinase [Deltaproteobacteria bacterium]